MVKKEKKEKNKMQKTTYKLRLQEKDKKPSHDH